MRSSGVLVLERECIREKETSHQSVPIKCLVCHENSLAYDCTVHGLFTVIKQHISNKGLSIYYIICDGGGGGLPDLLQYYIGGGLSGPQICIT